MGFLSGSVGVLSEGIHSFLDLISAAVAFFTIREAGKAADADHPFGHGKIETLSSLFESLLLLAAAGLIVYEGIEHFIEPKPVAYQGLAIATILVSMLVSYVIYHQNIQAARATESSAIQVNALHFLSDVVASAGILVGLIVLHYTAWQVIDPIMAFCVATYILFVSAKQVKQALVELSDTQLPDTEVAQIRAIVDEFKDRMIEAHDLRTRKSGATRHIDYHLVLCGEMSVNDSHSICDEMEGKIMERFPTSSVTIHVEPCQHENTLCKEDCVFKRTKRG